MAGHFLVRNISHGEVNSSTIGALGGAMSARQHADVGWNAASRLVLTTALNGLAIPNRNGLPPHVYLQFGPFQNSSDAKKGQVRMALKSFEWVDAAIRPPGAGLGLRALCPNAQASWAAGDLANAIYEQALHGQTSIEVYYVDNEEI